MPFVAPIVAGIAGAIGSIGAIAAPIVSGIGGAIGSAASFLGSTGGAILSGIGGTVGSVLSGAGSVASVVNSTLGGGLGSIVSLLTDTIGPIISGIKDFVEPLVSTVHDVISPIKDVADQVAGFARSIQDGLIQPIIGPIEATVSNVQTLTKEIHTFTSEGISGILKIPGAIADAFGNTAAAFDRSFQQLSETQTHLVTESLVPGITKAVAPGLSDITSILTKTSAGKNLSIDQLKELSLPNGEANDALRKMIAEFYKAIEHPEHWYESLVGLVFHAAAALVSVMASLTAEIEDAVAVGKAANPVTKLDASTVSRMFIKGIVTPEAWRSEMLFSGYDKARQDAIAEDLQFLPDTTTALNWWLRGLINTVELTRVLKAAGMNDADVEAYKSAAQQIIPIQSLLDWLARGIIDEETFVNHANAQGLSPALTTLYIRGAITAPQPSIALAALPAQLATAENWYAETYGSDPSPDFVNAIRATRLDPGDGKRLWASHWNIMPVNTAVTLFFRGMMNRGQVRNIVAQNNLPPDMTDLLIAAEADLIQFRTIPSLLTEGILSEGEAITELKKHGYSDHDALLLIAGAKAKTQAKPKAAVPKTVELSASTADQAFRDGVISEDQYKEILKHHGYADADIVITVAIANYHIEHVRKADISATLKAEIALGTKSLADALASLHQDGFTAAEIERFQTSIRRTKKVNAKLPSEANIVKMHKMGLLTDADLLAALDALGYAAPWDQRMFTLITGGNFQDGTNGQSPPASTDSGQSGGGSASTG
jgi:hypothetical protein